VGSILMLRRRHLTEPCPKLLLVTIHNREPIPQALEVWGTRREAWLELVEGAKDVLRRLSSLFKELADCRTGDHDALLEVQAPSAGRKRQGGSQGRRGWGRFFGPLGGPLIAHRCSGDEVGVRRREET
jgi:hypothetical protein